MVVVVLIGPGESAGNYFIWASTCVVEGAVLIWGNFVGVWACWWSCVCVAYLNCICICICISVCICIYICIWGACVCRLSQPSWHLGSSRPGKRNPLWPFVVLVYIHPFAFVFTFIFAFVSAFVFAFVFAFVLAFVFAFVFAFVSQCIGAMVVRCSVHFLRGWW